MAEERLQKVLSRYGVASRRHAEELIRRGRVKVNGEVVDRLGTRVNPARDRIEVDGRLLFSEEKRVYLAFHKPKGVVTTLFDPQGRTSVRDFLQEVPERVFPVGRLDYDSEGLLLLTNDGELAHRLTHPRYKVPKTYTVWVAGQVGAAALARLARGVLLEDGWTQPAVVEVSRRGQEQTVLRITITEGKKRQVRRMCAAVGHPVLRLVRTGIGTLRLGRLKPGAYRHLSSREVGRLKREAGLEETGKKQDFRS